MTSTKETAMADIKLYGADWCPDCKRSKKFLADQRVKFEWRDIGADPESQRIVQELNAGNNVIPTIVFPDGSHLSEPSNEELADKLGISRVASMHIYDVIIVGGGPTGLTTSIYAAREDLETLVIDSKGLGGQAGVTERLDNYPGFPEGIGGAELADRFVEQAARYGVEMLQAVSVTSISRLDETCLEVATATGDHYEAHAVLVATGSSYRRTGAPGEEELIGGGIHFCSTCDGPFYKGSKELMVVGGGNSGLEEGLFLTQFTDHVTVIEFADTLKASRILQDRVRSHPKMDVLTSHAVKEFKATDEGKLGIVIVEDRATGALKEFDPAAAFIFVGLDPNTGFLRGLIDLDQWGFVMTDPSTLMTSARGVFAAGDVRAGSTKQLASAVGEGAAVALQIRAFMDKADAAIGV